MNNYGLLCCAALLAIIVVPVMAIARFGSYAKRSKEFDLKIAGSSVARKLAICLFALVALVIVAQLPLNVYVVLLLAFLLSGLSVSV